MGTNLSLLSPVTSAHSLLRPRRTWLQTSTPFHAHPATVQILKARNRRYLHLPRIPPPDERQPKRSLLPYHGRTAVFPARPEQRRLQWPTIQASVSAQVPSGTPDP